jgi:hypothetical protein
VFRFLSQNLFCKEGAIISPRLSRRQVLRIPFLENSDAVFMAGEDLDQVWRDLVRWNGNLVAEEKPVIHRFGGACPARGCNGCPDPECLYAAFIRQYWDYPRCD